VKREGSKQDTLASDFRKMFARQISKVQLHRRRLQSKVRKNLKVGAYNVKSMATSTFECKFVLRIGFNVKAYFSMSSVGLIHYTTRSFGTKNYRNHQVCLQAVQPLEYKALLSMCVNAKP